jgi:hypothetical protein
MNLTQLGSRNYKERKATVLRLEAQPQELSPLLDLKHSSIAVQTDEPWFLL